MSRLEEIQAAIVDTIKPFGTLIDNNELIVEEEFYCEDCKNDDDCTDQASGTAEQIVNKFPELKLKEVYCHRHKYAVCVFTLVEPPFEVLLTPDIYHLNVDAIHSLEDLKLILKSLHITFTRQQGLNVEDEAFKKLKELGLIFKR